MATVGVKNQLLTLVQLNLLHVYAMIRNCSEHVFGSVGITEADLPGSKYTIVRVFYSKSFGKDEIMAPSFSSKTLALYKSLTYLLTYLTEARV